MAEMNTIQTGAHQYANDSITNYSLMLGGLNVTHDVLSQYDPLVTGYGRLFMVRKPLIMDKLLKDKFKKYKHILEYGNTSVTGIGDVSMDFETISGGYAGRSFDIPKVAKDETSSFTVKVYELSGSPIREINHAWINAVSDLQSGFAHYGGLIASGELAYSQSNHTAEFIYVVTDRTGMKVEYACMFANCMPKGYKNDQFNYSSGEHNFVETDIEFTCTKYESIDINLKAKKLLQNYQILVNSLEFNSGLSDVIGSKSSEFTENASYYSTKDGMLKKSGNNNAQNADQFFTSTGKPFNDTLTGDDTGDPKVTPSYTTKGNTKM